MHHFSLKEGEQIGYKHHCSSLKGKKIGKLFA